MAAIKPEIGNAYYALSKNALNFASKILYLEQKKRSIRVNTVLLGLIKNKMGNYLIDTLPLIKKNKSDTFNSIVYEFQKNRIDITKNLTTFLLPQLCLLQLKTMVILQLLLNP